MTLALVDFKDGVSFTNAPTGTVGPFYLLGGRYQMSATAAGTSNKLQSKMPDGTFVDVDTGTSFTTAGGSQTIDLGAGTYQFAIVTSSVVAGALIRVPNRGP